MSVVELRIPPKGCVTAGFNLALLSVKVIGSLLSYDTCLFDAVNLVSKLSGPNVLGDDRCPDCTSSIVGFLLVLCQSVSH